MKAIDKKQYLKIGRIALYMLAIFIFQEIVFRVCFPLPELANLDKSNYTHLHRDNKGRKFLRNQNFHWQSSLDTKTKFKHEMNLYGFRDHEWFVEKKEGKKRAIFIGDSFVEGVMAPQNKTISEGFKKASKQKYEAFNGGMVGVGIDSYLQLLADLVPTYKPDVVFFCIYANDLASKIPAIPSNFMEPEYFSTYKPRLIELLQQANGRGPIKFRWSSASKPYFEAVPSKANPWTQYEKEQVNDVSSKLAKAMKKGTYNPYRTNALYKEERSLKSAPFLGDALEFLNFTCKKYKVKPVVVYIPGRNQVTTHYLPYEKECCQVHCNDINDLTTLEYQLHQRTIARQCIDLGIQFIDLTSTVREQEDKGNHLYWNYDEHMRGKGYLFLGKSIWKQWKEN